VPHHGAAFARRPARLERLLAAVTPRVILVSVGFGNRYGHPRAATLKTLSDFARTHGSKLVCSEINGHCLAGRGAAEPMCGGTTIVRSGDGGLVIETERANHDQFTTDLPAAYCRVQAPAA
jgi:hypothetical protein